MKPLWPTMSTDDPPSNEEIVGHNLACIADRLEAIGDRLDGIAGALERVSGHLFDFAQRRP